MTLAESEHNVVAITRRGKPVPALMTWAHYKAIIETMEIMCDANLMTALKKSIREVNTGKTIPWIKARKRLLSLPERKCSEIAGHKCTSNYW